MKNVIKDKLERFNYLSINSEEEKLSKDFCLNLVVELAELNSNTYLKRRNKILVLANNHDKCKSRIVKLQSRYYPNCFFKKYISIHSYKSYMNYSYGDAFFDLNKLSEIVQRKDIRVVYIEGWDLSGEELEKLKKFSKLKEIYIIHYLDYDDEIEWVGKDSIVITHLGLYKYLCSHLNNRDEIISQKIQSSGFVHL